MCRNPYRTAPGSVPPELAGRESELGAARYAIAMTNSGAPAKPIVFTGLRGMGKTALLRRCAADALEAVFILEGRDRKLRQRPRVLTASAKTGRHVERILVEAVGLAGHEAAVHEADLGQELVGLA